MPEKTLTRTQMTMHANERRSLVARAQRRTKQAGAAMVEYALLLFGILLVAGGSIKSTGPAIACSGGDVVLGLIGAPMGSSCGQAGGAGGGALANAGSGGGSGSGSGSGSNGTNGSGGSNGSSASN